MQFGAEERRHALQPRRMFTANRASFAQFAPRPAAAPLPLPRPRPEDADGVPFFAVVVRPPDARPCEGLRPLRAMDLCDFDAPDSALTAEVVLRTLRDVAARFPATGLPARVLRAPPVFRAAAALRAPVALARFCRTAAVFPPLVALISSCRARSLFFLPAISESFHESPRTPVMHLHHPPAQ